jgi:hypothetical protein
MGTASDLQIVWNSSETKLFFWEQSGHDFKDIYIFKTGVYILFEFILW